MISHLIDDIAQGEVEGRRVVGVDLGRVERNRDARGQGQELTALLTQVAAHRSAHRRFIEQMRPLQGASHGHY